MPARTIFGVKTRCLISLGCFALNAKKAAHKLGDRRELLGVGDVLKSRNGTVKEFIDDAAAETLYRGFLFGGERS